MLSELITIGSRPALRGDPSTFFGVFATPQFVQALFTVSVAELGLRLGINSKWQSSQ